MMRTGLVTVSCDNHVMTNYVGSPLHRMCCNMSDTLAMYVSVPRHAHYSVSPVHSLGSCDSHVISLSTGGTVEVS